MEDTHTEYQDLIDIIDNLEDRSRRINHALNEHSFSTGEFRAVKLYQRQMIKTIKRLRVSKIEFRAIEKHTESIEKLLK